MTDDAPAKFSALRDWYESANVVMFKGTAYTVGFLTYMALVALGFQLGFFPGVFMAMFGYWFAKGIGMIAGLLWIVIVPLAIWALFHFHP